MGTAGVVPHLVHVEPHAINSLFQHEILLLLLVELCTRLLRDGELVAKMRYPLFVGVVLPDPFLCLNLLQNGAVFELFDLLVALAEGVAMAFGLR